MMGHPVYRRYRLYKILHLILFRGKAGRGGVWSEIMDTYCIKCTFQRRKDCRMQVPKKAIKPDCARVSYFQNLATVVHLVVNVSYHIVYVADPFACVTHPFPPFDPLTLDGSFVCLLLFRY